MANESVQNQKTLSYWGIKLAILIVILILANWFAMSELKVFFSEMNKSGLEHIIGSFAVFIVLLYYGSVAGLVGFGIWTLSLVAEMIIRANRRIVLINLGLIIAYPVLMAVVTALFLLMIFVR